MSNYILCFDIGGSSLKCAVCKEDGVLKQKETIPMRDTLSGLCAMMKDYKQRVEAKYTVEGVAISACGAIDCHTGRIGGCSALPFIHGPSWKELINEELSLPCAIENDANCAALSELYFGKAKDIEDMCFLVIGTGVGGAIVKNRKIHHGAHLYGGEFGMMLLRDKDGSIINTSMVASTSSMVRKMEEQTKEPWDGKRIFDEAEQGNALCKEVIQKFYEEVAFTVFNIQHMLDPQMILFGGAISARPDFCACVMAAYQRLCEPLDLATITPKLVCCSYLQDANLLGAYAHYQQDIAN